MRVFPKIGGFSPQIIHFNRVWNHYKPSIMGGFTTIFGNTYMSFSMIFVCFWAPRHWPPVGTSQWQMPFAAIAAVGVPSLRSPGVCQWLAEQNWLVVEPPI